MGNKNIEVIEKCELLIDSMKKVREGFGLTAQDLSDLTDIPQPNIIRLETMVSTPSIQSIYRYLMPLGYELTIKKVSDKPAVLVAKLDAKRQYQEDKLNKKEKVVRKSSV